MGDDKSMIESVDGLVASWSQRPSWDEYFICTAILIASRSSCRRLNVGCVMVSGGEHKNRIIAAGYNGFLPGAPHSSCVRDGHEVATVHAEQNAIISAERNKMIGSTLFMVGKNYQDGTYVKNSNPCALCKMMIINAGIKDIYIRENKEKYRHIKVQEFIEKDESLEGVRGY